MHHQNGNQSQQQMNQTLQGLVSALQNFAINQPPPPARFEPPFGGMMAKYNFQSSVAQIDDEKTSNAIIDSGATHLFFHSVLSS